MKACLDVYLGTPHPQGRLSGLSAGAPRARARPGADLELRRPAWKLTRSILASFGVYYGVNFMVGIITSVVSVVPTLLIMNRGDTEALYLVSMAIQLVISLALTIGAYCFTIHTMKKKLNLP